MENWLHHLDADTPRIPPFQLKWDQQQLVHRSRRERVDQHKPSPGMVQSGQVHEEDSAEKAKGRRE